MQRSMPGSVDYSIKPQFDPGYGPQTLLHPLLHKQSPWTALCRFVTEKETEREGRDFKILQGPTKATALLHLLYIIQ